MAKSDYFFVASKLGNDLVMDVQGDNADPGTPVISYPKKSGASSNQVWTKQRVGDTTFYLVSKLGPNCRLSIQGGKAVISTFGSLLKEDSSPANGVMLVVNDTGEVLDIKGSSTKAGTPIIAYSMNGSNGSVNQHWEFYPAKI